MQRSSLASAPRLSASAAPLKSTLLRVEHGLVGKENTTNAAMRESVFDAATYSSRKGTDYAEVNNSVALSSREDCMSQMSESSCATSGGARPSVSSGLNQAAENYLCDEGFKSPSREDIASDDSIQVHVRVRPFTARESESSRSCLIVDQRFKAITLVSRDAKAEQKIFSFDSVSGGDITQEHIFRMTSKAIIDACMCGYNGTIFAYGQTGSGKSFTIQGPGDRSNPELRGIIPRSMDYIFALISRKLRRAEGKVQVLCKASFMEIYNEQIVDLLDTTTGGLQLREDLKKGVYVENLSEEVVSCPEDIEKLLELGYRNRHVGLTSMNHESSRSHSVFTLVVESKEQREDGIVNIRYVRLNIVDLAGSERQKSTDAFGIRLKEAGNINKSLSVLGNVINALVDMADGKSRHIHYRDSKLTFYLKDSLGGNSKTSIITTVSPNDVYYTETLSTLKFAQRAKLVKNKAIVNEDMSGNVKSLQNELRNLREELSMTKVQLQRYQKVAYESPLKASRDHLMQHPKYQRNMLNESVQYESADAAAQARIRDLEELLKRSLDHEQDVEEEKLALMDAFEEMKILMQRMEIFIHSLRLINKLREDRILRLELNRESCDFDASRELVEEINALKLQVQNHPEAIRIATENIELNYKIRELEKMRDDATEEKVSQLRAYVGNLNSQVRKLLMENASLKEKSRKSTSSSSRRLSSAFCSDSRAQTSNEEEIVKLRTLCDEKADELLHSNQKMELLETQNHNLQNRVVELEEETASLRSLLEKKELVVSHLNAKLAETNHEESQTLRQLIEQLNTQISDLNRERCLLMDSIAERKKLCFEATNKIDELILEKSSIATEMNEHLNETENEIRALEAKISSMEVESNMQRDRYEEEISRVEELLLEAQSKTEKGEAEILRLEQEFSKQATELDSVVSDCNLLKEQLEKVEGEQTNYVFELSKIRNEFEIQSKEFMETQEKYHKLQEDYSQLMEKSYSSTLPKSSSDNYIDVLISDKRHLLDTITLIEFKATVDRENLTRTQSDLAQTIIDLEASKKREKDMDATIISLQDKVRCLKKLKLQKDAEIEELRDEVSSWRQMCDESFKDCRALFGAVKEIERMSKKPKTGNAHSESPREYEMREILGYIEAEKEKLASLRNLPEPPADWLELSKYIEEQIIQLNDGDESIFSNLPAELDYIAQIDIYMEKLQLVKLCLLSHEEGIVDTKMEKQAMIFDAHALLELSSGQKRCLED